MYMYVELMQICRSNTADLRLLKLADSDRQSVSIAAIPEASDDWLEYAWRHAPNTRRSAVYSAPIVAAFSLDVRFSISNQ